MTSTGPGAAFLLAQLGAHGAQGFAARLEPLGLTPAQAGVLRRLSQAAGESQRELAGALGMHPPRLVALIDELEGRGLVRRERGSADRRSYRIILTPDGERMVGQVGRVARDNDATMTAALDEEERTHLVGLLRRIADEQGLTPGVHPGYRRLG